MFQNVLETSKFVAIPKLFQHVSETVPKNFPSSAPKPRLNTPNPNSSRQPKKSLLNFRNPKRNEGYCYRAQVTLPNPCQTLPKLLLHRQEQAKMEVKSSKPNLAFQKPSKKCSNFYLQIFTSPGAGTGKNGSKILAKNLPHPRGSFFTSPGAGNRKMEVKS